MKKIAVLGSTGSIGVNTLNVIRHLGANHTQVVALAAHSNIDLLEKQVLEFKPSLVAVYNKDQAQLLKARHPHITILGGLEGVEAAASYDQANFVVSAMSGTLGLSPTLAAVNAGKAIGLANKESLVSGGALIANLAKEKNVPLLPIDSEHSAIFQCLNGERKETVSRLILTASGGPFRSYTEQQLSKVTLDQALNHPTWKMGSKITIDSSTLMNKGLEVIEAHWLFDIPYEKIEVVIHPQSIIHSMVEFTDHSILAQMGEPSMVVPIQYALTFPERLPGLMKPFDFGRARTFEFYKPDMEKFKCLKLAWDAGKVGGSLPCYMNAANEILVNRFLEMQIRWMDISGMLEKLMQAHVVENIESIEHIFEIDKLARLDALHV